MLGKTDLIVAEWIKKAHEDELVALSILKHQDAPQSMIAFHAQQMAEKLFKACLVHHTKAYPKIHPLDTLWELCKDQDPTFEAIKEDALLLTSFYGPTRYPGDVVELTWPEAKKAFESAKNIKDFVLTKISG